MNHLMITEMYRLKAKKKEIKHKLHYYTGINQFNTYIYGIQITIYIFL